MKSLRLSRNGQAFGAIVERRPFHNSGGSLTGRANVTPTYQGSGRMPADTLALWNATEPHAYVIYSYATPIAWVTASGEIVVPSVRYSVTTSRHQSVARLALENAEYARGAAQRYGYRFGVAA